MLGTNFKPELLKIIDEEQLPDFLGGQCTEALEDDPGPWHEYELVDGCRADDIVGVRKIGPTKGMIFTPLDFESLPNPLLKDPQAAVTHF